jgi:hypothetical protein
MKRNVLLAVACAALTAAVIGVFAVAPAGAAAATNRAAPVPASPFALQGTRCTTLHSLIQKRTGIICITVQVIRSPTSVQERGEVTFRSKSGKLKQVTAGTLNLLINGRAIEIVRNAKKSTTAATAVLRPRKWSDEVISKTYFAHATVINACLVWPGGGKVCTGRNPFRSQSVRL